jgi:hypothetical protein
MALLFLLVSYRYLLCICHFDNASIGCDIVFQNGQILFAGFAFLHFCNKCDICTEQDSVSGCVYGKISVINHNPLSILSVSPKIYIEVIPFRLRSPIPWCWLFFLTRTPVIIPHLSLQPFLIVQQLIPGWSYLF